MILHPTYLCSRHKQIPRKNVRLFTKSHLQTENIFLSVLSLNILPVLYKSLVYRYQNIADRIKLRFIEAVNFPHTYISASKSSTYIGLK